MSSTSINKLGNTCVQKSKNRRNALSKCSFVKFVNRREKFKAVSHLVWVCWKAMIEEKTIKED
jgi:hypothetical protein